MKGVGWVYSGGEQGGAAAASVSPSQVEAANPNPHPHPHPYRHPHPHPHPNPNQVVLMALLPFLVDNKWVVNCKEMAKELGIY